MEKSSYAMAKFGLEAKEAMPKRDCGFYVKYIFLFTSLIQFLIILGLVLFMVYGNAQAGTDTHLRLLEEQLQDRYNKIITLSGRNMNLTRTLNATLKEKQGLQVLAQKVQKDLDKCNSTQPPNPIPKVSPPPRGGKAKPPGSGGSDPPMGAGGCKEPGPGFSPARFSRDGREADRALLRSQLDQTALAKKEMEENCRKAGAMLTKATQEQESCQRDLLTTRTMCESTKTNLELQKHECDTLRSDMSYALKRFKEMVSPYSCSAVHEQLSWLMRQMEALFLSQQERETKYVGKNVCDMNLLQCRRNCSMEKQELEKRLQDVEKQVKSGQEEKKQLLTEKEKLGKELEEKSKLATQAGYLKEQLNICMGSKMDAFFDIPGSRVPGGSLRPGPFASTGSYVDALRNQGIFGNMGKINTEEMQRSVQKIIEQYMSTLKNPR
ncbi:PREDICTED: plasmalemma vesicle-associated protein [Nipponia nippon]|uniref:plasmalemma vesicle-associated protein n=1 Tax=Nipponia nippon TaxID=128390 RepID=UPI0005117ED1|nr:PREDICTED: plasmalemma vesicle-associated protein [Nipponia nippon]